ncbi:MAG: hypothetical protein K9K38_17230 [Rhodoferax sp.]|nr:hypothetical protein [Rhodoferax sp.]
MPKQRQSCRVVTCTTAAMPGTLAKEMRCAQSASVPDITALPASKL